MSKLVWYDDTGVMCLPERVTIETLPELLKPKELLSLKVKTIDFGQVQQADSAVLALLLMWSKNSPPPMTLLNPPTELQGLITLYDLESVINVVS